MRGLGILGVVLVLVGIVALAIGGFSMTTKETVAEIGPLSVQADKQRNFFIPPVAAIAAIVVGGGLIVVGRKK